MNRKETREARARSAQGAQTVQQASAPLRRHVCGWSADEIAEVGPQVRATPTSPWAVGLSAGSSWAGQRVREMDKFRPSPSKGWASKR